MTEKNMRAPKSGAIATAIVASGAIAASAGVTAALAASPASGAADQLQTVARAAAPQAASAGQAASLVDVVAGRFAWSQAELTQTADLARNVFGANRVLCGSAAVDLGMAAADTAAAVVPIDAIAVGGDVANPGTFDVAQMKQTAPIRQIMGCTCAGNPVDGRASGNAAVAGFQLAALIDAAQPAADANAITFVCADGYEVTLPLAYVMQRYSIIVDSVNGQDSAEAVGCANQLWLGSTAARTFARDVVEVLITCEDEVPAVPQSLGANLPNISLL